MKVFLSILKILGLAILIVMAVIIAAVVTAIGVTIGAVETTIKVIVALVTKNNLFIKRFLWWSIIKWTTVKLALLIGGVVALSKKSANKP